MKAEFLALKPSSKERVCTIARLTLSELISPEVHETHLFLIELQAREDKSLTKNERQAEFLFVQRFATTDLKSLRWLADQKICDAPGYRGMSKKALAPSLRSR